MLFAQNNESLVDSSFSYLQKKFIEFKHTDSIRALSFANLLIKKATREKDIFRICLGYQNKSIVLNNNSVYINFLDSLIAVTRVRPTRHFPAHAYSFKADVFYAIQKNDIALKYYLLALDEAKKYKDFELERYTKNAISYIYGINGEYTKAKEIDLGLLKQYNDDVYPSTQRDYYYISLLLSISQNYTYLRKYDSAKYYSRSAYDLSVQKGNNLTKQLAICNLGKIAYHKGNYTDMNELRIDFALTLLESPMP